MCLPFLPSVNRVAGAANSIELPAASNAPASCDEWAAQGPRNMDRRRRYAHMRATSNAAAVAPAAALTHSHTHTHNTAMTANSQKPNEIGKQAGHTKQSRKHEKQNKMLQETFNQKQDKHHCHICVGIGLRSPTTEMRMTGVHLDGKHALLQHIMSWGAAATAAVSETRRQPRKTSRTTSSPDHFARDRARMAPKAKMAAATTPTAAMALASAWRRQRG